MLHPGAGVRFCLVVAFLASGTFAFGQAGDVLTNDDIIRMVGAQLSTNIIATTIQSAPSVKFDLSANELIRLKEAGVDDRIIEMMQSKARAAEPPSKPGAQAEKSEQLSDAKDRDAILRSFKTMFVDASHAVYFGAPQIKAALIHNKDWAAMRVSIVDDPKLADVILEVGYTFAWDYPFSLKHQNTSVVLVAGMGSGPLSGPRGATSVATELVKLLKPYRTASMPADRAK